MKKTKPTNAELEILSLLWAKGPSTVREIHDALPNKETGYTTTLKLMQIMLEKDQVTREEDGRTHTYKAKLRRESLQKSMLGDLMDKLFEGSSQQLVMRALSQSPASKQEIEAIRKLIDELEEKQ